MKHPNSSLTTPRESWVDHSVLFLILQERCSYTNTNKQYIGPTITACYMHACGFIHEYPWHDSTLVNMNDICGGRTLPRHTRCSNPLGGNEPRKVHDLLIDKKNITATASFPSQWWRFNTPAVKCNGMGPGQEERGPVICSAPAGRYPVITAYSRNIVVVSLLFRS